MKSFPILVVDDDPLIIDLLNRASASVFPEATFIHVNTFETARQYIDNLEGRGPRLILLDVDLRENVSGLDFLKLLQAHPRARLLPVIVLSGNESDVTRMKAYNLGANSFIVKPFSYENWKSQLAQLRSYWLETVRLPQIWFNKELD